MQLEFDIKSVEKIIGYVFNDKQLLVSAFTLPSYAHDNGIASYNRLEHLGDSILGFCVSRYLFDKFPNENEDFLTEERKKIVAKTPLAETFDRLVLSPYPLVSKNQLLNEAIKSDIIEALIAAIYLDSRAKKGIDVASNWIIKNAVNSV